MTKKYLAYALFTLTLLSLLAACGPEASPSPPAPTSTPTEAPADTPTPAPTPSDEPAIFEEGFEETLNGWQQGADVPEDPDNPGQPVAWSIEISADQAVAGKASARFTLDGKQDDGTIWLMHPLDAPEGESLQVRLAFDLWSASESFNTIARVAAYAGAQPPEAEADFDLSRAANEVGGWKRYEYTFQIPGDTGEQIWVALGISAVWETQMTYYVDNVRVEIAPTDEGQPPGGDIAIEGVRVTDEQVIIRGTSTLPEETCINTELWADGTPLSWWPTDAYAPVREGAWELNVPLEAEQTLQPGVQYMVRAYQPGGPNVVATFPFDLDGPPPPPGGDIAIEGVRVTDEQVIIRGTSTLPEETCINTELWADGAPLSWWPTDACAPVREGTWELAVPLEAEQTLQPGVQYMVRAYQPGGPNIVATFPFDLDGPPPPPTGGDPTLILPESAVPLHTATADLKGDGTPEEIVLTGWGGGGDRLGYDFLQMFVIATDEAGEYYITWQSEQLPTDRAEPLQMQDINGDGLPEVVSMQAMGASGETLYLLGWQGEEYGWLTPQGGHFDGQDSFGETGVRLEDRDGDGLVEILACYGPASQQTDIYNWDGESYVYRETLRETGSS